MRDSMLLDIYCTCGFSHISVVFFLGIPYLTINEEERLQNLLNEKHRALDEQAASSAAASKLCPNVTCSQKSPEHDAAIESVWCVSSKQPSSQCGARVQAAI